MKFNSQKLKNRLRDNIITNFNGGIKMIIKIITITILSCLISGMFLTYSQAYRGRIIGEPRERPSIRATHKLSREKASLRRTYSKYLIARDDFLLDPSQENRVAYETITETLHKKFQHKHKTNRDLEAAVQACL